MSQNKENNSLAKITLSSAESQLAPRSAAERFRALAKSTSQIRPILGLQVAFFFDTTGSMYPYFDLVRESLQKIMDRIVEEKIEVEFAFYAYKNHGDEGKCDGTNPFVHQKFTSRTEDITYSLQKVYNGGGGDGLCALEDAFHDLNRSAGLAGAGQKRLAIVVGDVPPHGVIDSKEKCPQKFDQAAEVAGLVSKKFVFYSVFCAEENELASPRMQKIQEYYRALPTTSGGKYLDLKDIEALVDIILAICLKAVNKIEVFQKQLLARKTLPAETRRLLEAINK